MRAKAISLLFLALLLAQPVSALSYPITVTFGRSWPLAVVVDSNRGLAYFDATSGDYPPTGYLFGVVNVTSHTVEATLPLDVIPGPVALNQANGDVYVAGNKTIAVFDGRTQTFAKEIGVGRPILDMTFDSNASQYIFFTSGNDVYSVDPSNGAMVANATVGNGAGGLVLDPTGGKLYVAQYLSPVISIFDPSTLTLLGTIQLTQCCASQLAIDPAEHVMYASTGSDYVDVVNLASQTLSSTPQVAPSSGNSTNSIAVDTGTGRVFVSSTPGGSIIELDGPDGAIIGTFKVYSEVAGLAADTKTGELYATNYHQVTVFNVARGRGLLLLLGLAAILVVGAAVAILVVMRRRKSREKIRVQEGSANRKAQDGRSTI